MARIAEHLKLTQSEVDELLSREHRLRIATMGPGTDINLTPMSFGYADGRIYIFGRGQKVVNLRRNPTATVLVDIGDKWEELQGVMLRGTARVLESMEEELDDQSLLKAQFNLGKKRGLMMNGRVQPFIASAAGRTRRWIVFEPAHAVSWDNDKLNS